MRLFIAINFDDRIKDRLWEIAERLRENCVQGNFTRRENFHLTLVFIGETKRIVDVIQAMDKITAGPLSIKLGGLGSFQRNGGDIYWIGVERNASLLAVYSRLYEELAGAGFSIDSREYRPHLTLGREVILRDGFDKDEFSKGIPQMTVKVNKISLMKSERINGKLVYTEMYSKPLH